MALDRDATLKKAEKLLRQGRLEPAIAEYVRVVDEFPRDWSTANTLGELYARAGQTPQAVAQYSRIAQHFVDEGFYPKAAALYKKILKLQPQDEVTQIQLADISARQGLLADAKSHLNAIAARRRAKGDRRGAAEIVVRLGTIDPADFDARLAAARTLEEMGEEEEAGKRFKALHDDLLEKGRTAEAIEALKEFVRINPLEREARSILAKSALEQGDVAGAREFLDEDSAGDDPVLLLPLAEIELRSGELTRAKGLLGRLMTADPSRRGAVTELGWSFVDSSPETTFICLESAVDGAMTASAFEEAAASLQEFVARVPGQIPALLKLVEVCVDGGLEQTMYEAQEQLADAYLAANQAAEARVIAEDLVAREPWEPGHIDRFRRALVMLRVSDPDTLIAERLSGQAPFMAKDLFFEGPETSAPPTSEPDAPETEASSPAEMDTTAAAPVEEDSGAVRRDGCVVTTTIAAAVSNVRRRNRSHRRSGQSRRDAGGVSRGGQYASRNAGSGVCQDSHRRRDGRRFLGPAHDAGPNVSRDWDGRRGHYVAADGGAIVAAALRSGVGARPCLRASGGAVSGNRVDGARSGGAAAVAR